MKARDLREKTNEQLLQMKKELELGGIKASSSWGRDRVKKKEAGENIKGITKKGEKTSLQKNIRRNIARVNTILKERENVICN